VKTRKKKDNTIAGHVSFVVGKSKDGTKLYMIGGNQSDISIAEVVEYDISEWNKGFYFPIGYDEKKCSLEVWKGRYLKNNGEPN